MLSTPVNYVKMLMLEGFYSTSSINLPKICIGYPNILEAVNKVFISNIKNQSIEMSVMKNLCIIH